MCPGERSHPTQPRRLHHLVFIPLGKHCTHKLYTIFLPHPDTSRCILHRYVLLRVLSSGPRCTYKHTRAVVTPLPSSCGSLFCSSTANIVWYTPTGAYPGPIGLNSTDTWSPTSQGKIGMRRSSSSGSPMVHPGRCHRTASRMRSAPWVCWKPSPSHPAPCTETLCLSIFFSRCRGWRASPLHRDGEGASN